jgi:hypothetical protein
MESLLDIFESLLGSDRRSGQIFEVGPREVKLREAVEPMDVETGTLLEILEERARLLHVQRRVQE